MIFLNIASGSKGNATFISYNETNLLIDVGVSLKEIEMALSKINKSISDITNLLITHEHSDHVKSFEAFIKKNDVSLHMSKGTAKALNVNDHLVLESLVEINIGNLKILPIPLSHDANEPIGLVISNDKSSICYITDTGFIHHDLIPLLKNHHLYYLEANHDPFTLTNCNRPVYLKNRIAGEKGHLSNYDSAYQFSLMVGSNTKHLIHAHISNDCNSDELIEKTFKEVLNAQQTNYNNVKFYYAKQNKALEVIVL